MSIAVRILLMIALMFSTASYAADEDEEDEEDEFVVEYVDEFLGGYIGVSTGVNSARSSGVLKSRSKRTIAYLVQAGYLQAGYNFKLDKNVLGVGGFADMHGFERHKKSKLAYGNLVLGLNLKLARPVGHWLPYVRLGYGYGDATGDLTEISGFSNSYGVGAEYKFAGIKWSAVMEFKASTFSKNGTRIFNKSVFTGLNYYFNEPTAVEEIVEEIEFEPLEVFEEKAPEFAPPI